jgi:OOP family OmpA-OmpF porin
MADEEVAATGSPFSQALFKDYTDLATQAAGAPAPQAADSGSFFGDILGMFDTAPENPADAVADLFRTKASRASTGSEPSPEAAPPDAMAQALRARLVRAITQGKDQFPDEAARAQADYDCWVVDSGASNLQAEAQACRASLNNSLVALENASRPAPPPRPAPVASAPVAAPPAPADYTVYFDLDSWTLTAEDLTVITNVINNARAGGQSRITVVGHTDTSGSAAHNKRLSVRRANVVVEALVDLGARRAAIQASGVGENDLAVPTPDGTKEAKNRRAVIAILP